MYLAYTYKKITTKGNLIPGTCSGIKDMQVHTTNFYRHTYSSP